ncbi:MAG TPA: YafY family protein [Burkholderiaceae bacterium]|nr:YafY family protein [Burkholderiaceae bacterium]
MRASRLLSVLMLLQGRGRMTAQAIAGELEVSPRTILRDLDHLSGAGVPVWAERGRNGGFQLREGWSTRLTGLTEPEAQALFLTGLPAAAADLGLGGAVASARLKVLAALPADWRSDAQRVSSRLHVDPIDWFRAGARAEHLAAVADAVWKNRRLAMRYESWSGIKDREVEPLGLVLKAGVWYMVGRASGRDEPRVFRLSNVHALTPLRQSFEYPDDFDLAAYWSVSTRRFEASVYHDQASLHVSARGLALLQQFPPAVADAARRSARPIGRRPGWSRVTIPIESVDHAVGQLLRLGAEAEARTPPALRARMRDTAAHLVQVYARSPRK